MSTERGRIQIRGFDSKRVENREPISGWTEETGGETIGRYRRAFRRFTRNRLALLGVAIVVIMALVAFFAKPITVYGITVQPFGLAPYSPTQFQILGGTGAEAYSPPSLDPFHPMGTDHNSRDILSRWLVGGRYSVSIGFIVVTITAIIGVIYGAVSGYYGGWVDEIMMRILDIIFAFPGLVLALVIVAMLGGGYWQLVLAFSMFGWAGYARLIRGEILSVKENEYVLAAKALGARDHSVIFRHIVPNAITPVIVQASLGVGTVVIGVAALGFLGIGFEPGTPEWGTMLDATLDSLVQAPGGTIPWWATIFPGLGIFIFVMAMNLVGDGINDALNAQEDISVAPGGGG
ncbi:MAG: ABC transporter permease [Halobacteriales archaeon]